MAMDWGWLGMTHISEGATPSYKLCFPHPRFQVCFTRLKLSIKKGFGFVFLPLTKNYRASNIPRGMSWRPTVWCILDESLVVSISTNGHCNTFSKTLTSLLITTDVQILCF